MQPRELSRERNRVVGMPIICIHQPPLSHHTTSHNLSATSFEYSKGPYTRLSNLRDTDNLRSRDDSQRAAMSKPADSRNNEEVSSTLVTALLFLVHSFTNALFLSPLGGDVRCLFWEIDTCSRDEEWIATWFAFSHFHVCVLLSGIAYVASGTPRLEATLSYVVAGIIFVYLAEGIMSIDTLNLHLASVQVVIFVLLLIGVAFSTAEQERNQPRIPLPRKLTTTSFDRRNKISMATIATGLLFLSSMYRVIQMVLGGANGGYKGDSSSAVYRSISNMALCDMMLAAAVLAISLRFLEADQQKIILWCEVSALLLSQAMLAGETGEMIEQDMKEAGGIATFVSIVIATIGAL